MDIFNMNIIRDDNFVNKVVESVETYHMFDQGDKVIVGVSGGADSVALLVALMAIKSRYALQIFPIHINHMLRGKEAKRDEDYVEDLCEHLGLRLDVAYVDVKAYVKEGKLSEEEAGRKLRFREFHSLSEKYGTKKIALAHHMNDQGETILFNMMRGTGLRGLGGIKPVRDQIVRPLIDISREEIENFCKRHTIQYMVDHTNDLNIYSRNKIRNQLIPFMKKEFNTNIVNQLSKMGKLLREDQGLIDEVVQRSLQELVIHQEKGELVLDISKLKVCSKELRKRIYRQGFVELNGYIHNIDYKHIELIEEIINKRTGKVLNLPGDSIVRINYNQLIFEKNKCKKQGFSYNVCDYKDDVYISDLDMHIEFKIFPYNKNQEISKKVYTKWFDYDKIKNSLSVRTRLPGDYIYLQGLGGKKKIKDFFIDEKIDRKKRDHIPLITVDEEVVWIIGYRINRNYMITEETEKILEISVQGGKHEI